MRTFIDNERNASRQERRFAPSGFTLIELLTVIAIIGMLGAISISTVRAAIESARVTQTRTTIAKIDNVLTSIYEKYQYRRVDLADYGLPSNASATNKALARLLVMRDLIRCDMPCYYAELETPLQYGKKLTPLQESYEFAVKDAHMRRGIDINSEKTPEEIKDLNPELLYLVLTNAAPECRSSFSDRELADTDGDGLLEFVDGWGKPIRWLRWAPCLYRSDRQPIFDLRDGETIDDWCARSGIYEDKINADPLDPLSVLAWQRDNDPNAKMRPGWFLVPYVYSAGPDGGYGIHGRYISRIKDDGSLMNDPFTRLGEGSEYWLGLPEEEDGVKVYKDNIDNHTLIR